MTTPDIQKITTDDLSSFSYSAPEDVAVIMPCTDTEQGQKTAEILHRRAGMYCKIIIAHDINRQGFIKTLNDTAARITAKYIAYLAQDAYPGRDWLKCAYDTLENTGKGLLAFNDGKWQGRIASFGMVRTSWVKTLYNGPVLYPGYKSHAADNELTVIARCQEMHEYNPDCTLLEYDLNKDFGGSNPDDKELFQTRFRNGFDGLVSLKELENLAKEYKVDMANVEPEKHEPSSKGLSVIISVNEQNLRELDHLLSTILQKITLFPFEVIIADQTSGSHTRKTIQKHVTKAFIRHLHIPWLSGNTNNLLSEKKHKITNNRHADHWLQSKARYSNHLFINSSPSPSSEDINRALKKLPDIKKNTSHPWKLNINYLLRSKQRDNTAQSAGEKSLKKPSQAWPYSISEDQLLKRVRDYNSQKNRRRAKVVVYTAISNNYDILKIPEVLCPEWDYVCYTDRANLPGEHPWQIRHFDYINEDSTRTARYYKTHPHYFFNDYEYSIWIDAHILIKTRFLEHVTNDFIKNKKYFAAIPHPFRNCTYQEAKQCEKEEKDNSEVIKSQMKKYHDTGFPKDQGLIETQILIRQHNTNPVVKANKEWWNEIEKGSKRDQLSLMFVLWKNSLQWTPIMKKGVSTRTHEGFKFFKHGLLYSRQFPAYRIPNFLPDEFAFDQEPFWLSGSKTFDKKSLKPFMNTRIDIVVCVHNALDDVKNCLKSVLNYLRPSHKLIIVDDGSDEITEKYLKRLIEENIQIELIRNNEAQGYTKSANLGLKASSAPFVVVLNSDTMVSENWTLKLLQTAQSNPYVGVVGPMTNAGTWQSLPHLRDPNTGGMAINDLPRGKSVADMDRLCEYYGWFGLFSKVPLINGFCYGIKRDVIDAIGYFDENAFPKGYGEEDDYSIRALNAGFINAIATHCFVFHAKSKSFGKTKRTQLAQVGGKVLRSRHGEKRIHDAVQTMSNHPLLRTVRVRIATDCDVSISEEIKSTLPLPQTQTPQKAELKQTPSGNKKSSDYKLWSTIITENDPQIFPKELTLANITLEELNENKNFVEQMRGQYIGKPQKVLWILPAFRNILAGGIRTIFMVAENFSKMWGAENFFIILKNRSIESSYDTKQIQLLFPHLNFSFDYIYPTQKTDHLPRSDIAFCSSWPTAYILARYNNCRAKFYFMQDYETLFYPAGSLQGLIEQTYQFGFYCIANTKGIADKYRKFSNAVDYFVPGIDKSVFTPIRGTGGQQPPWQIVFYGRPLNHRNAFALGLETLKLVKNHFGDDARILSVGADWSPEKYGVEDWIENLGTLGSMEELAALYRRSHLGLVFMLTPHPSYQPLEYMASGCVTATNQNFSTQWLFRNGENATISTIIPADMARNIIYVLENREVRERIITGGLKTVENMNWTDAFDKIRSFVENPDKVDRL